MTKLIPSTLRVYGLLLGLICTPIAAANEPYVITYPTSNLDDARIPYYLAMIELSASKVGFNVKLEPKITKEMRDNRAMDELEKGSFDIYWMATNPQREERLFPVRIPLFKGLNGWRICLVNDQRLDVFSKLNNLADIKNLVALQGIDWPDTDIFIANGYRVQRSVSWTGMFDQISLNRQDYLPRAVTEIYGELEEREYLHIAVEPSVVFTYPTAFYLFTNKNNAPLALLLEQGFKQAIADGSFDALFTQFHGAHIEKANLANRTRIPLRNPALPTNTPLGDTSLWYNPQ